MFALVSFVIAWIVRQGFTRELWKLRVENLARIYTAAVVTPPLAALWLMGAAFLPRLWMTSEAFEAAHPTPYHQLHLLGELTIGLQPTLSYALGIFVVLTCTFGLWSNAAGTWRISRVVRRLDLNAEAPSAKQIALVDDFAAQRGLAVGLVMTDYPLSFVWGILRSKLVLSSGLLRTLTPEELTGVLEHEATHHQRRDNLLRILLSLCSYASLAFPLSRVLLRWRATEVEAVCDDEAVSRTSQPLELAEALVKLRRQTTAAHSSSGSATTGSLVSGFAFGNHQAFEYRVNRLLLVANADNGAETRVHVEARRLVRFLVVSASATLLGILFFAPLSIHHATESFIEILK